jgi:hypothetical protein
MSGISSFAVASEIVASGEFDSNVEASTPFGLRDSFADVADLLTGSLGSIGPHQGMSAFLSGVLSGDATVPKHIGVNNREPADDAFSCERVMERLGPVPGESALNVLLRSASTEVRKEALQAAVSSMECTATTLLVREASRQQQRPVVPAVIMPPRSNAQGRFDST